MKTNDGVSFFFFSFLSDRDDLSIPGFEEAGNLKIIIFIARWIISRSNSRNRILPKISLKLEENVLYVIIALF